MPRDGTVTIGVLGLQGAFGAHRRRLAELGVHAPLVRRPADLAELDGLVMPGGESTTMSKLLGSAGVFDEIERRLSDGLPVFATCAGLILLAGEVMGARPDQRSFGVLDAGVRRNAYGRQIDSFEADLSVAVLGDDPFHAVFIRAPVITSVGPTATVLAEFEGDPVLVEQATLLATTFHPELTPDARIHRRFVERVRQRHDHSEE